MVMECEGPAKDSLKALLGESPKVDYYAEALNKLSKKFVNDHMGFN